MSPGRAHDRLLALLLLVLLVGCQGPWAPTPLPDRSTAAPTSQPPTLSPTPADTPEATSVIAPLAAATPLAATQPPPPTAAPDPLRFIFPTVAPAPVSAWRPPLYPTPWAPTPFDHFFFARPIAADEVNWPLADYRYGGVFLPEVVHSGVDIPAPLDTPVLATGPGKITWVGYGLYRGAEDPGDPYGLAVAIKHDFGYQGETLYTVYGHMSQVSVVRGQHVETGEPIGLVGETGFTTGPHLHFEVRIGRNNFFETRNPELWMSPPQGWGVLAGRVMTSYHELVSGQMVKIIAAGSGQTWEVKTYGKGTTNEDPYYHENLVIGDLPAGRYFIWIPYEGGTYDTEVYINPGMVSFFTFQGEKGLTTELPPTPQAGFTPPATLLPTKTATPTP